MPIGDSRQTVSIQRNWPEFKKLLDGTEKALRLQAEETDRAINLFVADESVIYRAEILKSGFIPNGWTQQQITDNGSWRQDYESNWSSGVNQPQRIASAAKHYNGTATTTPAEVVFSMRARSILIENMESDGPPGPSGKDLLVSLDGGAGYKTLDPESAFEVTVELNSIWVKTKSGTADYEVVITY